MPPLTKRNHRRNDKPHRLFFFATSSLRELGLPLRKTSLVGETYLCPTRFLGEVKLSTIFSFKEKNLPLREVKLSLVNFILYLGEMGPPFGNIGLSGETCLSPAFFLGELNFLEILSFRERNLPLREKSLFLEEHSLNLPASFSLGEMNLPHGGVDLSPTLSLGGMNSSREFILPFGESFIFLENRICCSIPCRIPFIEFLPDGGSVQTATHSFFDLSTQTRQYLGTHTFLGESFPTFLDSINALRSKLVVLIEATSGKGFSSIAIVSFLSGNLSIPL